MTRRARGFTLLEVLIALAVSVTQTAEARRQRAYALQEGKSRDAMLNYVTDVISVYAPRDRAVTSAQLLALGVDNIDKAFKDDRATCHEIAQLFSERLSTLGERESALRAQQLALSCARQSESTGCKSSGLPMSHKRARHRHRSVR